MLSMFVKFTVLTPIAIAAVTMMALLSTKI